MTALGHSTLLASTPAATPVQVPLSGEATSVPAIGLQKTSSERGPALARNVFCPECSASVAVPSSSSAAGLGSAAKETTLNLMLVGTMEGIGGEPSFATVYDADAHAIGLYTVTDTIRPDVSVARVEQGRVHVIHGDRREVLLLGARAPPVPSKKPAGLRTPPNDGKPEFADQVQCSGDSVCVVDRALVDKLTAQPSLLSGQFRVVQRGADGFALYGIRRGSLPKLLGLKNGDVLVELNGQALDSVDGVMRMYAKLRNATRLEVTLQRRGKTLTKEIQIE